MENTPRPEPQHPQQIVDGLFVRWFLDALFRQGYEPKFMLSIIACYLYSAWSDAYMNDCLERGKEPDEFEDLDGFQKAVVDGIHIYYDEQDSEVMEEADETSIMRN
jgi:hypothetical protein